MMNIMWMILKKVNTRETSAAIDGIKNLLFLGKYAGVGKTTLAVKLGTKILIISPYNAL